MPCSVSTPVILLVILLILVATILGLAIDSKVDRKKEVEQLRVVNREEAFLATSSSPFATVRWIEGEQGTLRIILLCKKGVIFLTGVRGDGGLYHMAVSGTGRYMDVGRAAIMVERDRGTIHEITFID